MYKAKTNECLNLLITFSAYRTAKQEKQMKFNIVFAIMLNNWLDLWISSTFQNENVDGNLNEISEIGVICFIIVL